MSSEIRPITSRQIVAARGLLDIKQAELADAIGMFPAYLSEIENRKVKARPATLAKIREELERRGIEFINGRGVVLKKPAPDSTPEHDGAGQ